MTKKIFLIPGFILALFFNVSCNKNKSQNTAGSGIVNKTITAVGGTVTSSSGNIEIIIPSGALSNSTDIAIEEISNLNNSGIGKAYRLLPEGLVFSKPVILKLKYTDSDAAKTFPETMSAAFKKQSAASWQKVPWRDITLDKTNKTIVVVSTHFSDWTIIATNGHIEFKIGTLQIDSMDYNAVYEDRLFAISPDSINNVIVGLIPNYQINIGLGGNYNSYLGDFIFNPNSNPSMPNSGPHSFVLISTPVPNDTLPNLYKRDYLVKYYNKIYCDANPPVRQPLTGNLNISSWSQLPGGLISGSFKGLVYRYPLPSLCGTGIVDTIAGKFAFIRK